MRKSAFPLFLLLLLLFSSRLQAGDDGQAVGALWNDFVSALRRGDYRAAHGLFSPESRSSLPYGEFVREYGPLSAAREMVLARPESQSTRQDGDWAEIVYAGVNPGSGRPFKVGVAAVRNIGAWGLVAARNDAPERLEAAARGVLLEAANWRGGAEARRWLQGFMARDAGSNPLFQNYTFETDGITFRAMPKTGGLRAFHLDEWGQVRPGATPAPPAPPVLTPPSPGAAASRAPLPELGQPPPLPPPPPARRLVNGLPELSEPPGPTPLPANPGELSEPPPPPGGVSLPARPALTFDAEAVRLPDVIR